ncbi:tetratricopeptide repeat protein [Kitasatospora sp. NPDC091257]|uniref:tetratricopeptide repeat protein n=1 Tax=Kitasatospora sp. NPDC091257 TaxID=3364084 RepID=UPI0038062522
MLDTPDAVMAALRENDARPYGRTRTVTAEELVDAAEQFEDTGIRSMALLELMEAYEYDGERSKSPVVFARILKLWDTDPDGFGEWARRQVLWRFKWVADALKDTPDVPLAAIRRWHTELRDRYRTAGHDLQPYYAQRYHLAVQTGLDVQDAYELWAARPRSELSDCHACETRARARHFIAAGDDARALEVIAPVLDGRSGCEQEPYLSQATALLAQLRRGRLDEARSGHLSGYRYARGKASMLNAVGLHIEFCALSGNEPRGLELLAENRDLFAVTGEPAARLGFLTGVEVLLALLARAGHGGLAVSGPAGTTWTVDSLLAHVRTEADALAARFDARNGTGAVGAERRARLAVEPLLAEPLALGVRAVAAPGLSDAPAVAPAPRRTVEPEPEDFTALVLRARELEVLGHPDADRLWKRVAERAGAADFVHPRSAELGGPERLRAELAEQRAHEALQRDAYAEGKAGLLAAAELFEQAGLAGSALMCRARTLIADLDDESDGGESTRNESTRNESVGHESDGGSGRSADADADADTGHSGRRADWAALDAALARAEELRAGGELTDDDYLIVLQTRAYAAHHDLVETLPEPADEVAERFEAVVGAYRRTAVELGSERRAATSRQYTADAAARKGLLAEAEAELREVLAQLDAAELPWHTPRVLGLLGQVLLQSREPGQAVEVFHRALAEAVRWGDDSYPYAPTYMMLGHGCLQVGDLGGAVRALSEAAARYDRKGAEAVEEATRVRMQLADVLRDTGRAADAVAVLESVLLDASAARLDVRMLAQARLDLARGLSELEEHRDAAEEYLRLADLVAGWEDQETHTMVACEATLALARAERPDAAEAALARAREAHGKAPQVDQLASTLRELARMTMREKGAEGLAAALALLAEADAVGEAAEQGGEEYNSWYLRGGSHYERARSLAVAGRYEEALAEAERAVPEYEAGGERAESPRAESVRLAALIEGSDLGRTEAAVDRLTAGIARCEAAGLSEAAEVLVELRERFAGE